MSLSMKLSRIVVCNLGPYSDKCFLNAVIASFCLSQSVGNGHIKLSEYIEEHSHLISKFSVPSFPYE